MSYTVLAVRWRPRRFEQLVGQQHVVKALVNSLASERLHHAYLFSGTRGVGKTTIARILAKALNCEQGVVAEPCGECEACTAIDEGRFVDLIEVDAASRTRVDDTRELLDNVQYAPTKGRFKIYLIDEVHMLSNHSFNALLKTLEEPPPHVKFLLATTDPQKLPVTVLSRCLQFHLKKHSKAQIQEQLAKMCAADGIEFDDDALASLARAADGSMRDAQSLLDQAIAFGDGRIAAEQVAQMLGSIDKGHVLRILESLVAGNGASLVEEVDKLEELAADYSGALEELMSALQRIAVIQLVEGRPISEDDTALVSFAGAMSPEDVQLYYEIAARGLRDLNVCRDRRMGFEMSLLRMLAFRPASTDDATLAPTGSRGSSARPAARQSAGPAQGAPSRARASAARAPSNSQAPSASSRARRAAATGEDPERRANGEQSLHNEVFDDWPGLLGAAEIRGPARQLADNCEVAGVEGTRLQLVLAKGKEHLQTDRLRQRLEERLSAYVGRPLKVSITPGTPPRPTPAELRAAGENERMRAARESIEQDANILAVQAAFDAVVEADSIQPIDK